MKVDYKVILESYEAANRDFSAVCDICLLIAAILRRYDRTAQHNQSQQQCRYFFQTLIFQHYSLRFILLQLSAPE